MHTPHLRRKSGFSASYPPLTSSEATPSKSKGSTRLTTVLIAYAAMEFLAVTCSTFLAQLIYHHFLFGSWQTSPKSIFPAILIATLVLFISIGTRSLNIIRTRPQYVFLWKGLEAVALAFSIFLSIMFVVKLSSEYSRVTFVSQIIGVCLTVTSMRVLFYSWLRSAIITNKIEARRVALVGNTSHCSMYRTRLKASGIQTVAAFCVPTLTDMKAPTICEVIAQCRSLRVEDVIVLANNDFMHAVFDLTSSLAELPAGIHIVPVDALETLASAQINEFGNFKTIQVYRPPLSAFDLFIKRTFDLVCAIFGLIALSPLFLLVSIAIKLETRGPVFFRQKRHGFNNEEIRVFKFRSMNSTDDVPFKQAIRNDPRVTRFGSIIRGTNIDELPQLFNVFLGEMSIVGPRPHATAHNALFSDVIAPFSRRHKVKPGITGWAQVNGFRGATDTIEKMQRRIEYDLHYVDNWSFLFDMKIILMTIFSKRAYMNAY
jgi:Undecaprenyl-phosphate glucose phosphotransferase